jgi:hypothetical protein
MQRANPARLAQQERKMRAILVKPDQPETPIEVVDYDGDWKSIYALISYENHAVDTYDAVYIDSQHVMFVDDNGLITNPEHFVIWNGYPQPLAGRALILGYDDDGDNVACSLTEEWVRENTRMATLEQVRRYFE